MLDYLLNGAGLKGDMNSGHAEALLVSLMNGLFKTIF